MNNHPPFFRMLPLVGLIAWAIVGAPPALGAGDESIVVILNNSNPVDNLTTSEIRKLFLAERSRWDTGKSVAPVMPASGQADRVAFLKIVCGMKEADFNKYFVQAAFTGKIVSPPKEVSSSRDVRSFVASSPGGVGFVRASDLHGDASDGAIKTVKVDGLSPSDSGYKLKL